MSYYADYHMHTYYSDDSKTPMEDMVKTAIAVGLDEIAFTEHVDYGVKTDLNCDYDSYVAEVSQLKEKYKDQIRICMGMEFGVQEHTIEVFRRDADTYPFEFIILSNHQVGDKEFWNQEYQQGKTQDEIHKDYYQAIYNVVCQFKDYSVLGHLDMIKRYDEFGDYPDDKIMDIVEKILKQVIADGKGIEVNTSSFDYGLKDLTPSREILKLYHDLGGEIITIGSDTHDTSRVGQYIETIQKELKDIGFTKIATFRDRKPVFHQL